MPVFGHSFRKKHFPRIPDHVVPVNHGSYGLPPEDVIREYHVAFNNDVAYPDEFMRLRQQNQYRRAVESVASIVKSAPGNLALVENATTAVNSVLQSVDFKKGDVVVMPTSTYGACANTVRYLHDYRGVEFVWVELVYPLLDSEVVAKFRSVFEKHHVKLALFDAVLLMPGVVVPWVQLVNLCKEFGVLSLVDGAHALGLVPLELDAAAPDFFCSNLHKWLHVPRGCALLYVHPRFHRTIQSLPVSHSYVAPDAKLSEDKENDLLFHKFSFNGLRTFAAIATVPKALEFRKNVCGGEETIRKYCYALAQQAAEAVLKQWPDAQIIENEQKSLSTAMVSFFLPIEKYSSTFDPADAAAVEKVVQFVAEWQITKKHTFVPIAGHAGRLIGRLSAQVYNEASDYVHACGALDGALRAYFTQALKL